MILLTHINCSVEFQTGAFHKKKNINLQKEMSQNMNTNHPDRRKKCVCVHIRKNIYMYMHTFLFFIYIYCILFIFMYSKISVIMIKWTSLFVGKRRGKKALCGRQTSHDVRYSDGATLCRGAVSQAFVRLRLFSCEVLVVLGQGLSLACL